MQKVLYIGGQAFHPKFPAVIYPEKNENYPGMTVSHQEDGKIVVGTTKGHITLNPDDVLRYHSETGEIHRIPGPASFKDPFRKILAATNLGQKMLETNLVGPAQFNSRYEINFHHGNHPTDPWAWGEHDGENELNMIWESGQWIRFYTRPGADKNPSNISYFESMLKKNRRSESRVFQSYLHDVRLQEEQEELVKEERCQRTRAKSFKERKADILDSGRQTWTIGTKTYIVHRGNIYRNMVSRKTQIDWQKAFDDGILRDMVWTLNQQPAEAASN